MSSSLLLFPKRFGQEKISMIYDRTRIQQYLDKSYKQEFHMVKAHQITNLEKMKTTNPKIQSHYSPVEAIVNISKWQLTTLENLVLNKGLNFATTIKRIPYLDLIASIEDEALKIPKARADELRWTGSRVRQTPKEGRRIYQPKRCGK